MSRTETLIHNWAELLALPKPKVVPSSFLESSYYERKGRSHIIHVRHSLDRTSLLFHELGHFFLEVHHGKLVSARGFSKHFGDRDEPYDSILLNVPGLRHLPSEHEGFVSRYAEVHPEEDWAESFATVMKFVHKCRDLELTGDRILDAKLLFIEKAINKAIDKSAG